MVLKGKPVYSSAGEKIMETESSPFSIWGYVDKALVSRDEKKLPTSWHASGFGSCPTGRYLERMGVEPDEEFDERTLRVFSAGKKFEDWIIGLAQEGLQEGQISLQTQVRAEIEDWGISGYADAVVGLPDRKIVYEVKSKHSNAFHWMKKRGEGAMFQHQMQTWIYLYALKHEEGRILYISKDDLAFVEYPVFLSDDKIGQAVVKEVELLNRALVEKLPPPPIADPAAWQNKYCRWHKKCISQEKYLTV